MAGKSKKKAAHSIGSLMTRAETLFGWCWLPLYLALLSYLLRYAAEALGLTLSGVALNLACFGTHFIVTALCFRSFLGRSFRIFAEDFWLFVQTLILGFVFYYIVTLLLTKGLHFILGDVTNYNNETVVALMVQNRTVMFFCTVLAAPLVEEVLLRGVVFGSLQPISRPLAYIVSVLLFSLMHIWQYAGTADLPSLISSGLCYIPAAVALGWTYEKSCTIWAPVLLHAAINALSFFGVALF